MKFSKQFFGVIFTVLLFHALDRNGFAAPRPPQPPWPQATLRIYGFDSAYAKVPWRNLAVNETESAVTESWSGYSLSREGLLSAPVVIPVRASEKEVNIAPSRGAIRFWFAPNWSTASEKSGGKGPSHAARLLELVNVTGKAQTRWSLFLNETGDTLSLAGATKSGVTVLLKAPVEFQAGDWRMITLCYSETNTLLLLDNEAIAKGEGLLAPAAWEEKDLGLVVGSDVWAAVDSVAEGQFEELTMLAQWPKQTDWQEMYFKATKRRTLLGALGTQEEEQAKVATLKSAGLLPEDYGVAAKSNGANDGPMMIYNATVGALWLEITGVSNNLTYLIVHGTEAGRVYEILSKETLAEPVWLGELPLVFGAAGQDWTATTVVLGTRTNNLFFRVQQLSGYAPGMLWLEITGLSNSFAHLIVHGTMPDEAYEILSKDSLIPQGGTAWAGELPIVLGAAGQDWTPTTVTVGTRTNNLFLWARVLSDADGDGLPDWWELAHGLDPNNPDTGNTGVSDSYKDGDNDGWINLQEYQNGTSPTAFNSPPVLQGIAVTANPSGYNVISWSPPAITPTTFTIQRNVGAGWQTIGTISGQSNSYTDTGLAPGTPASYQVRADYVGGASAFTSYTPTSTDPKLTLPATVVSGPGGRVFVLSAQPSLSVTGLVVSAQPYDSFHPKDGINAVNPVYPFTVFQGFTGTRAGMILSNSLTGVPFQLSTNFLPTYGYYQFSLYSVGVNGKTGQVLQPSWYVNAVPYLDGRLHLLDNLNFTLRAGNGAASFDFYFAAAAFGPTEATDYGIFPGYTTAGYNGKFGAGRLLAYDAFDELQPFEDGSIFRAFCYASNRFDAYGNPLDVGFDGFPSPLPTMNTWNYYFSSLAYAQSGNTNTPPRQLDATTAQYLFYGPVQDGQDVPELGLVWNDVLEGWQVGAAENIYGLPIQSVRAVRSTQTPQSVVVHTAAPGGFIPSLSDGINPGAGWLYFEAAPPQFQNIGWHMTAGLFNNIFGPGFPGWNGTNQIAVPILSAGDQVHLAVWAKLAVTNGAPGTIAYLQHYFDRAYRMDTNGVATTNQTGILSEYGDFFAPEPGAVAVVTKPDAATGLSFTGAVHVIALNVDANRDGVMDFTFGGPDSASVNRPYRFWINNDNDSGEAGTTSKQDVPGNHLFGDAQKASYTQDTPTYRVNGMRDLVDWFPVYINIGSLLQVLPPSATVQYKLKQQGGSLRMAYTDLRPDQAHDYLTDTTTARNLASSNAFLISFTGTELNLGFLNKIAAEGKGIILVQAGKPSAAPLILEVWKNNSLVAQTELPLSITGVEDMFRHKNLIRATFNNTEGPPDRLTDASVPNEPETNEKNFVFLHGYNVNPNQARGWQAEMFKRMYWSGSRAKFYGVTWFGSKSQGDLLIPTVTGNYHTNVVLAFQQAPQLADFLATLTNGPTAIAAHSLGNMITLSALSDWSAPFDKYFMIDAAVAIEAIDGGTATSPNMIHPDWSNYTNRLFASKWFTLFSQSDGRSSLTWSNRFSNLPIINLYNFYSSGEEVLRTHSGPVPTLSGLGLDAAANAILFGTPPSVNLWALQEKLKGRTLFNLVLGSNHGGWGFNLDYDHEESDGGGGTIHVHMSPGDAALLSDQQLRTNAFFNTSFDTALFGANGSAYAQANRNRILADAIPALTLPVAANFVQRLTVDRNFDMNVEFQNGWPSTRPSSGAEAFKWYHSDLTDVAYTFVHPLFDKLVTTGNLK